MPVKSQAQAMEQAAQAEYDRWGNWTGPKAEESPPHKLIREAIVMLMVHTHCGECGETILKGQETICTSCREKV